MTNTAAQQENATSKRLSMSALAFMAIGCSAADDSPEEVRQEPSKQAQQDPPVEQTKPSPVEQTKPSQLCVDALRECIGTILVYGRRERIVHRVDRRGDKVDVMFAAVHFGGQLVGKGAPDWASVRTDREGADLYFRITGKGHGKLEAALKASGR